ncbi:hypothetical protein GRZ46_001343 [Salmonella enterica subsp. salamae]|nr:hypothetical protein [Salmonella enterica subsp. enterica serovar Onderstepoort]EDX9714296.1 hypothetical protein [Salmonella enterica subsp. salamae]
MSKYPTLAILIMAACDVHASWYVGSRNPPDVVASSNVALSYINPTASVVIPAFNGKGMYTAASGLCGGWSTPHYTWTYVSMPAAKYFTQNSYIEFTGVGAYTEVGEADGQRRYYQQTRRDWSWGIDCGTYIPGTTNMGDTWSRPQMIVTARLHDGGDITPGYRRIEVPLRIAQVAATDDSASMSAALAWADANVHKMSYVSTTWVIEATITPKCWANTTNLTLSHGAVSANLVNGHKSEKRTLNLACNTPTDITVELIPVNPELAYGKSATRCGDGLVCIPTIDNGLDKNTYQRVSSINVLLTDELISTGREIKPGPFSGDAILRVTYN